jgi:hypothetical protein
LATLGTLVLVELTRPVREDREKELVPELAHVQQWRSGKERLVPFDLAIGWTGHSERSTLPSLLASMGVAKSDRDPLGRWSATGSDEYVRTYKVLVRSLAMRVRSMVTEGKTFVMADEEEAVDDVLRYVEAKGNEISPELRAAAAKFVEVARVFYAEIAQVSVVVPQHLPEVCKADLAVVEEAEEVAPFIIACTKRGASRCLHKGNGCWRARGLAFLTYELCHSSPVPAPLYNTHCRDCWPKEGPSQSGVVGCSSESSADSSSES